MPFNSITGRELGKKGLAMKEKYKKERLDYIASGGLSKALVILDEMLNGNNKITEGQKEAVEFLLKFLPYTKPKLSSVEQKVSGKLEIKQAPLDDVYDKIDNKPREADKNSSDGK